MVALRLLPPAPQRHAFAAFAVGVALGVVGLTSAPTPAHGAPDAAAVRKARDAFDEASRAYRSERYELAASQFEAADAAVPSARALRMAIRSRMKAEQPARAATLAAQALRRYPDDAKTAGLAKETIASTESTLHRVEIVCAKPCVLAVGMHAVHGKPSERWVLYLDEGKATVSASFEDGGDDQLDVQAVEGGSHDARLEPQPTAEPPTPTPPPTPASTDEPTPVASTPPDQPGGDAVELEGPTWIESPWVFGFWMLATAGVGGVTIWSGVDTLNNPGTDVVEESCVGQGVDCPEYQQGRSSQMRTNILIGATAGTAAIAAIFGIFVTDWDGEPDGETALSVTPQIGLTDAGVGIGGRF
jgi:hypothetical protein